MCVLLIKIKERILKLDGGRGEIDTSNIKQTGQGKFQHNMAYGVYKDLAIRRASGKILCDKVFAITSSS